MEASYPKYHPCDMHSDCNAEARRCNFWVWSHWASRLIPVAVGTQFKSSGLGALHGLCGQRSEDGTNSECHMKRCYSLIYAFAGCE